MFVGETELLHEHGPNRRIPTQVLLLMDPWLDGRLARYKGFFLGSRERLNVELIGKALGVRQISVLVAV